MSVEIVVTTVVIAVVCVGGVVALSKIVGNHNNFIKTLVEKIEGLVTSHNLEVDIVLEYLKSQEGVLKNLLGDRFDQVYDVVKKSLADVVAGVLTQDGAVALVNAAFDAATTAVGITVAGPEKIVLEEIMAGAIRILTKNPSVGARALSLVR